MRTRPETPSRSREDDARWQRALERALANALDVLIEPISGEAFVESATHPGTLYAVSATTCSCPAGRRGQPCCHRACYLAQMGAWPPRDPAPEPAGAAALMPPAGGEDAVSRGEDIVDCVACRGCGVFYDRELERAGQLYPTCRACQGRGTLPAAVVAMVAA